MNEEAFAHAVQEQLNRLPGPERTTYLAPFRHYTNGHDHWLVPCES
ncbi:hypothetical protein [Muricoccus aerilatus]|nr:hypothetical protein [Roseomonas aerilata]